MMDGERPPIQRSGRRVESRDLVRAASCESHAFRHRCPICIVGFDEEGVSVATSNVAMPINQLPPPSANPGPPEGHLRQSINLSPIAQPPLQQVNRADDRSERTS
jgi:hypothetical protein